VSTLNEDCDDPLPDYHFLSTCTGEVCYKAKYETEGEHVGKWTLHAVRLSDVEIMHSDFHDVISAFIY